MAADPDFRPTMNHVIDTRGVTSVSVTALGVRLVTKTSIFGPGSRRALIASDANPSSGYGYIRMFQTLCSQSGADTFACPTIP
jgi:hypothetical protein